MWTAKVKLNFEILLIAGCFVKKLGSFNHFEQVSFKTAWMIMDVEQNGVTSKVQNNQKSVISYISEKYWQKPFHIFGIFKNQYFDLLGDLSGEYWFILGFLEDFGNNSASKVQTGQQVPILGRKKITCIAICQVDWIYWREKGQYSWKRRKNSQMLVCVCMCKAKNGEM